MNNNPFFYGNPVSTDNFFNRRNAIRRIVGRLLSSGQSTAIIGEPRTGKTSLLHYLSAPENQSQLYENKANKLLFSYVDAQTLDGQFTQARFWEEVLSPIKERLVDPILSQVQQSEGKQDEFQEYYGLLSEKIKRLRIAYVLEDNVSTKFRLENEIEQLELDRNQTEQKLTELENQIRPIVKQYLLCKENQFGTFTLGKFFQILRQEGWQLVLLLDEFNVLMHHLTLNKAEFFGGLRSIASRSGGALTLIVASRLPLAMLNKMTQEINPTGSPFFNIFAEIPLNSFPKKDVEKLLSLGKDHFSVADRRAIHDLAGGHPFLLQTTASTIWEAHEEGKTETRERIYYVAKSVYREYKSHFQDTWRIWSPAIRKAFLLITLNNSCQLLENSTNLEGSEFEDLEYAGIIKRDQDFHGGWKIVPQVMLWWLVDELVRVVRSGKLFENWLKEEELEGLFTLTELADLNKVVQEFVITLKHDAATLIAEFAEKFSQSTRSRKKSGSLKSNKI